MWLDLVALVVLSGFAILGALRGGTSSLFGILSLMGGALAALALAPVVGPLLAPALGLPPFVTIPLAGAGLFMLVFTGVGMTGRVILRQTRARGGAPGTWDRVLGGVFGATRGVLAMVVVSWLALGLDALRASGVAPGLPSTRASSAAHASSAILETVLAAALEEEGREGRVVARLAARPSRAVTGIRMINESPAMGTLRGDHGFWDQVEQDNLDVAMEREGFTALVRDAAVRRHMADLGLVEEASARDPEAFRAELAEVLSALGPRLRGLRQAPDLQALVRDPEVRGMLERGDFLSLIRHPGVRAGLQRMGVAGGEGGAALASAE